jgi:hypothetical protein
MHTKDFAISEIRISAQDAEVMSARAQVRSFFAVANFEIQENNNGNTADMRLALL